MATAAFTSATIPANGQQIVLVFTLASSSWAGTITPALAGGDAVELVFPSGETRRVVSLVSTAISGSNLILTATFSLTSPVRKGQQIDALLIASTLLTDTSGDTTPSVATSSVTNNSQYLPGGARGSAWGRRGGRSARGGW